MVGEGYLQDVALFSPHCHDSMLGNCQRWKLGSVSVRARLNFGLKTTVTTKNGWFLFGKMGVGMEHGEKMKLIFAMLREIRARQASLDRQIGDICR